MICDRLYICLDVDIDVLDVGLDSIQWSATGCSIGAKLNFGLGFARGINMKQREQSPRGLKKPRRGRSVRGVSL